ncbi:MAG: hypothetical protein CMF62_03735 [Magnetococcales bacterium]|nr:hypothetical protein [Magnetococcales bacterium]|tara:strand:+ start:258 stop:1097 length:840 start_codon:yes stop_codon:yes gene_type:complete
MRDALGDRMKQYERDVEKNIDGDTPFLVRLDGKNFSKFTKRFKKPFDSNFNIAMEKTTHDLILKFPITTGYTCSDEITLIFAENNNEEKHIYSGRIQKLTSILASYCSIRFNFHINEIMNRLKDEYDEKFINLINNYEQIFDARVLVFDKDKRYEFMNHMIWRAKKDCYRNTTSSFGRFILGSEHKNKNGKEMIELMKIKGFDYNTVPIYLKYGVFCKKELYNLEVTLDGTKTKVTRSRVISKVCDDIHYSDEMVQILFNKYWNNEENFYTFEYDFDIN